MGHFLTASAAAPTAGTEANEEEVHWEEEGAVKDEGRTGQASVARGPADQLARCAPSLFGYLDGENPHQACDPKVGLENLGQDEMRWDQVKHVGHVLVNLARNRVESFIHPDLNWRKICKSGGGESMFYDEHSCFRRRKLELERRTREQINDVIITHQANGP